MSKKLLIGVDTAEALVSEEIFLRLKETFKGVEIITCIGQEETQSRIVQENPDVVFLYFDQDNALIPIMDIQWHVHETSKLDCKLFVYSCHKMHKEILEAVNRVVFLETTMSDDYVIQRVSFCFQSKGLKILLAMKYREQTLNHRSYINTHFPGNNILFKMLDEKYQTSYMFESPDIIIIGCPFKQETLDVLEKIRTDEKFKTKPPLLMWSPLGQFNEPKELVVASLAGDGQSWQWKGLPIYDCLKDHLLNFESKVT